MPNFIRVDRRHREQGFTFPTVIQGVPKMRCQTLQADREHQSEELLPRSFYLFRAYKKSCEQSQIFTFARKIFLCFVVLLKKFSKQKNKFLQKFSIHALKVSLKKVTACDSAQTGPHIHIFF